MRLQLKQTLLLGVMNFGASETGWQAVSTTWSVI